MALRRNTGDAWGMSGIALPAAPGSCANRALYSYWARFLADPPAVCRVLPGARDLERGLETPRERDFSPDHSGRGGICREAPVRRRGCDALRGGELVRSSCASPEAPPFCGQLRYSCASPEAPQKSRYARDFKKNRRRPGRSRLELFFGLQQNKITRHDLGELSSAQACSCRTSRQIFAIG